MAKHNNTGKWGEDLAADYLREKGYEIIERDWRDGHRDIDIIARSPDLRTIVFVEVKTRATDVITKPEEDCKGLCSTCGKNLNLGPCGCRKQIDPRFAVLEQLLDKE